MDVFDRNIPLENRLDSKKDAICPCYPSVLFVLNMTVPAVEQLTNEEQVAFGNDSVIPVRTSSTTLLKSVIGAFLSQ